MSLEETLKKIARDRLFEPFKPYPAVSKVPILDMDISENPDSLEPDKKIVVIGRIHRETNILVLNPDKQP